LAEHLSRTREHWRPRRRLDMFGVGGTVNRCRDHPNGPIRRRWSTTLHRRLPVLSSTVKTTVMTQKVGSCCSAGRVPDAQRCLHENLATEGLGHGFSSGLRTRVLAILPEEQRHEGQVGGAKIVHLAVSRGASSGTAGPRGPRMQPGGYLRRPENPRDTEVESDYGIDASDHGEGR
jgi:hypothetical protein